MEDIISSALSHNDNEFLVEHDAYVRVAARNAIKPGLFSEDMLPLEIDELSQTIRVKLWKSYQKHSITNPKAYIQMIAHTTAVDIVRRHRPTLSLSTDENGESSLGDFVVAQQKGHQDPAYEIECEEIDPDFLTKLVNAILSLPPRQKQAVLCSLKNYLSDILPLVNVLKTYGIDVETLAQPNEENEIYLLKASLSVARKKLQWLREELIVV